MLKAGRATVTVAHRCSRAGLGVVLGHYIRMSLAADDYNYTRKNDSRDMYWRTFVVR